MRKIVVWAAVLVLALSGLLVADASAEEQSTIQIVVAQDRIEDPNKSSIPIPQFPWVEPFDIEVTFVDPSGTLILTLSDFKIVSYDPEAKGTDDDPYWKHTAFAAELKDENDQPIPEFSFVSSEGAVDTLTTKSGEQRVYRLKKRVRIWKKDEDRGINLHIVFKQTLSKVVFEIDPPWVGKPPVG